MYYQINREAFSMDFMSVRDAASLWNISERRVQQFCEEGRIKGFEEIAIKMLHNKTPILEIQTLTGLPESRILELAKENNLL